MVALSWLEKEKGRRKDRKTERMYVVEARKWRRLVVLISSTLHGLSALPLRG